MQITDRFRGNLGGGRCLTATPTAPTAAVDTNTTQLATTAFVLGQAGATAPAMDGTAAVGSSSRFARADHIHPTDTSRAPLASPRAKSDSDLCIKIDAAWKDNRKLYGARKIWHVLLRDNHDVARCTVERLMRDLGLKGVLRGKKVITTNPDTSQPCPDDKVNRLFMADGIVAKL